MSLKLNIQRWLFSTNAKDIAILYFIFGLFSAMIGTGLSAIIRLELANTGSPFLNHNTQAFNVVITAHAILMIFFFVMPALVGGFGNKIKFKTVITEINTIKTEINNNNNDNLIFEFNNKNLGSYLAGLIEGDGNISVSQKELGKYKYNPSINIVFNKKDKPLCKYLINLTKCGDIKKEKGNHFIWQINKIKDIYIILNITNGYYRTPKFEAYLRAIEFNNDYYINNINHKHPNTINIINNIGIIKPLPLDNTDIQSNAWLAGFTDADGNFSLAIDSNRLRIKPAYRLEIRQHYNNYIDPKNIGLYPTNYFDIMSKIGAYLEVNLYTRTRKLKLDKEYKTYSSYIIMTNSIIKNTLVIEYFDKFPLLSSKFLDYTDWKYMDQYIKTNGQNKDTWELGLKIKKDYNSTRTTFTWKHLVNCYLEN